MNPSGTIIGGSASMTYGPISWEPINSINPQTYLPEDSFPTLDILKSMLIEMGVVVHRDMKNGCEMFEVFKDGKGSEKPMTARTHGAVTEKDSIRSIAEFIAGKYKHFAWLDSSEVSYIEMLTEKKVTAWNLRFAGWNDESV